MNLTINHLSETGNLKKKRLVAVEEVSFDYGYEFPAGTTNPAIKIKTREERYVIIDSMQPEKLIESLIENIHRKVDIILPYHIFDWGDNNETSSIDIEEWFFATHKNLWTKRNDANSVFSDKQLSYICRGNLSPILNKNISSLSDLWAQTLPTPGKPKKMSKKKFFYEILASARHRTYSDKRL